MVYNQQRSFAGARLREAARECKVHKKLLKLKGTASRSRVAELWEACQTSGAVLWGGKSVGGLG